MGYIEGAPGKSGRSRATIPAGAASNPDFSEALLELANLRIADKKFEEAASPAQKIRQSQPRAGFRILQTGDGGEKPPPERGRPARSECVSNSVKDAAAGPYPYQHLFDYLENRSNLAPQARAQLDLTELIEQIQKHPDQPQDLYLLAETYLKLGKLEEARKTIAQLDQISAGDYRTQTGVGVLLARYHLYDDAIQHFQTALEANPDSDDVKFDLADAYFRKGLYAQALEAARRFRRQASRTPPFFPCWETSTRIWGHRHGRQKFSASAISRNPDNDQYYLSLTLVQLREKMSAVPNRRCRKV